MGKKSKAELAAVAAAFDTNDSSSDQSVSMGDEEEEEIIPMKMPATENNNNNEEEGNFLDEDFLSFSNIDNGGSSNVPIQQETYKGSDYGEKLAGRKRDRSMSPATCRPVNGGYEQRKKPTIPWLDNSSTNPNHTRFTPPPQQQYRNNNNRGYGDNNYNSYNQNQISRTPPLIRLHNEIVSFTNLMSPTPQELELRTKMVDRVTQLAQRIFGGKDKVQVLPFGSQVTGLCLPGSDIDFVIRFTDSNTSNGGDGDKKKKGKSSSEDDEEEEDYTSSGNPLHRFADAVRDEFGIRSDQQNEEAAMRAAEAARNENNTTTSEEEEEHLSYLEVIEQTRVPLVKFTVAPYNIDIDVCFDQPNGPESAELMHRFMESMPPLRPLTFVLKYFLASRDINKPFTGGIGSYLLQMMIVSFLQHRVRDDLKRDCGSGGRHFNLGSLLLDFLEFYGIDFNYVTTGISVRHDGYYFPKGQKEMKDVFWQPSRQFALAMENPLDPTADVGAGAFRMQMIKRIFEHAYKVLLAYVSEPMEPTDSILAMIIPPTEEMEQRMALKKDITEVARARQVQEAERILNGGALPNNKGKEKSTPPNKGKEKNKKQKKKEKKETKKKEVKAKRKQSKAARKAEKKMKKHYSKGDGGGNNNGTSTDIPFHLRG